MSAISNRLHKESFEIGGADGEPIIGDVRYVEGEKRKPAVIIHHSFMSFKDWGWFPVVAEQLAKAGYVAVSFNFSRSGVRENPDRITDFETFQRNTVSHELRDATMLLEAVRDGKIAGGLIDEKLIALLGHSRGGAVAILVAAASRDVAALVTWSAVSRFDRWTSHQKSEWRKRGFFPMSRDVQEGPLKLGIELLEDVENNKEKLDITAAARRLRIPWLIIHGTEDLMVRFSEAEELYAASNKKMTELLALDKVGHLYDGPNVTEGAAIHRVIEITIDWLNSKLF